MGFALFPKTYVVLIPDFSLDPVSLAQNAAQQVLQSVQIVTGGGASTEAFPGGAWERDGR
ncbi:hypothetical protein F7734_49985 [Scytonema sp. UIC 10036]|uniref:hypothetical protein n=1 Tax=Scytonema sp. UIC 10036 TaxID=2304196 RepID=UPI0012DAA65C|nr:hypothetical protein [Scytonema sp. UIC 10036]MUG99979.1 hypothetical protein [Scytonema sp. UIC 10036]